MAKTESLDRTISRRTMLLTGIQVAAGFGLIGRLFYLQFLKSDEYQTLSEGNRIKIQLIPPIRGDLLDRADKPLAENQANYQLFMDRENITLSLQSYERIKDIITISPPEQERIDTELKNKYDRKPLLIKTNLTWDEVTRIEYHTPDLPSLYIEQGQLRYYPYESYTAHLTGYVGRVSEAEVVKDDPLFRLPEFKIGKSGAELLYEKELRGKAGARHIEVNATGLHVRELKHVPSLKGASLNLTIDADLQAYAAERMGEESGAVVVMDAHHGDVLALVSMPAFDPNRFSEGISASYWKELNDNEKNPLLNKAISGLYPPGSTFKMLVGLAGLKAGVINEQKAYYCPGHFDLGNHRFNCWKAGGHGWVNIKDALAQSCDTFFYNVGNEIGIEAITDMASHFGLGKKTELGLVGEKDGLLPSPEWKKRRHNISWVKGDTVNASIGQGYVLASPIQLAVMTARMVNGGYAVHPSLLPLTEGSQLGRLDVAEDHLRLILEGMDMVMNHESGTAHYRRIREEGFEMGGKTGTSQVRRITRRGVDQSTIPWRHRHHALFVGFAPVHNPRFITSVVIEHGGGGASAAAPVAKDVLQKVQELARDNPRRYRG